MLFVSLKRGYAKHFYYLENTIIYRSAEGGTRTHTSLRRTDFKSVASAIPPPRHEILGEAATGFEPVNRGFADPRLATWLRRPKKNNGAEDEIRTRDILLGKEAFYH